MGDHILNVNHQREQKHTDGVPFEKGTAGRSPYKQMLKMSFL